jgi:hypothetical protein
MTASSVSQFAVFLTVDGANPRPSRRLTLMRRFLAEGAGPQVTVVYEGYLLDQPGGEFLVLVQAPDRSAVVAALEPYRGVFAAEVHEATTCHIEPGIGDAPFCVLARHAGLPRPERVGRPDSSVVVRGQFDLPAAGPAYQRISFVDAPSQHLARIFGLRDAPGSYIKVSRVLPLRDYLEGLPRPGGATSPARPARPAGPELLAAEPPAAASADTPAGFAIYNEGTAAVLFAQTPATDPFTAEVFNGRAAASPGAAVPVSAPVYLWGDVAGDFSCTVDWWYDNGIGPNTVGADPQVIDTRAQSQLRWAYPARVIPDLSGATPSTVAGFDLASDTRFHARTPLSLWLRDLLTTSQYDLPWPEDGYTGGQLDAYRYILSRIPGGTPPNHGTITEPAVIQGIAYPNGAAFTATDLDAVQAHLLLEIDHFVTADRWFGIGGIISTINTLIGEVSTNDLISAAALMSIPPDSSDTVSILLDTIFGVLVAVISAIPDVGPVIAAVISVAWTTAQAIMAPQRTDQPITVAVAGMADTLNHYLENVVQATAAQRDTLFGNWGRLSEFSDGVITGIISEDQFYPDTPPGAGADAPPSGPPTGLLAAAADAWLLVVYQHLFAVSHTASATLGFASTVPANPWNPDAGQYGYTWSLPCIYYDSKGDETTGWAVIGSSTDAPMEVLQVLFGQNSRLHANPIEFFAGLNGWPTVLPVYNLGKVQDLPDEPVPTPIVQIGY